MITVNTLWGEETIEHTKVCIVCGEEKPLDQFALRIGRKKDYVDTVQNRRNECGSCKKKLTAETKKAKAQLGDVPKDYCCPICERNEEELKGGSVNRWGNQRPWVVDHCHTTGKPRGWICQYCNISLGATGFNESIKALKNAIKYLQEHNA